MLLLVAVPAAVVSAPTSRPTLTPVAVEATATVRVISGVRLKLDSPTNPDAPRAHQTSVTTDGAPHPAQLIEFE